MQKSIGFVEEIRIESQRHVCIVSTLLGRTCDCGYFLQRASPPTEEDIDENWLLGV